MQTAQATVPYLQNPAVMKKDYAPTENHSEQKNSFSDTLKQGLSKGTETESTADNTVSKNPNQTQKEPIQEVQKEPQVEGIVIPIMPGLIQTPNMPQEAASETVMPIGELVVAEIPETQVVSSVQSQALVGEELTSIADNTDMVTEVLPKQVVISELQPVDTKRQMPVETEQKTGDTAESTIQQTTVPTAKVVEPQPNQAGENAMQQGRSQAGTENADVKNPELVETANRQDINMSQTAAFEVPKTAQKTSVDMTNVRTGIQNLARTMADHMATGKNEFEIWLEPANLGKMAIKVAYESGRAMVSIMCTNEKTMELISQNAKQLGSILQQHTGDETVVVIDHPESDYLQQKMDQEQQKGQQKEQDNRDKNDQQQDTDHESFLQQLRLGLM